MPKISFLLLVIAMMLLADATPLEPGLKTAKAIYFLSNDAINSVVALKVNADGTLSRDGSITLTGGSGASGIDAATNAPADDDVLFSQSALKAEGNVSLLAAVSRDYDD